MNKDIKKKKRRAFSDSFYEILRNRKYIGEYVFNTTTKKKSRSSRKDRNNLDDEIIRIPGGLPQIIDQRTFDKIQHMLNKRRTATTFEFKPTKYLMTGKTVCGYCAAAYFGTISFGKQKNSPYSTYSHVNYRQGRCKAKEIPIRYLDNWIQEFAIKDFISISNLSERTKGINNQIMQGRELLQNDIKVLKQQIKEIEQLLEVKAKQLVSSNFSIFVLEDAESTKSELSKFNRDLSNKERKLELLKRITQERLQIVTKKIRNRWKSVENKEDISKFIYELLSKVEITNENIIAYVNYDMLTGKLCDFEIEIARIDRNFLMKIWRNNTAKNNI